MSQQDKKYPRNKAYIQDETVASPHKSKGVKPIDSPNQSPSVMSASVLSERVQYLEEQLVNLANTLNDQNSQNQQWQEQLTSQNARLQRQLSERDQQIDNHLRKQKEHIAQIKELKDNLYRQNEEMEMLHREVVEMRNHQPKRQQRNNGGELEQKVLELNDEVSTLLGKIHQLIEQNNQQQTYIQEMDKHIEEYKKNQEALNGQLERINDENNYLKDEIKEVEQVAIAQQAQIQNRLLQELEETKRALEIERSQHKNEQSNVENYSKRLQTDSRTEQQKSRVEYEKEMTTLRSQIHTLEEQLHHQRQVERSLRKKYEERMKDTEHESDSLNDQMVKLKHKIRQLEASCQDHTYALQQLHKDANRPNSSDRATLEHYKNIIIRLQAEKEDLNIKVKKSQSIRRPQNQTQLYSVYIHEAEIKMNALRQQLAAAEDQNSRSRRTAREVTDLAKRWQQDYRQLSQDYEEALKAKAKYEQKVRAEQDQLTRHKQIYEQVVRKADHFEELYRQLEVKVHQLQAQRNDRNGVNPHSLDTDTTDLIRLQNSTLRQQVAQLNIQIQDMLSSQSSEPSSRNFDFMERRLQVEAQGCRERQKNMERMLEDMRRKLTAQTTNSHELMDKNRQINQQLLRVNRALNQKEKQLDELRERYNDLHFQMTRKQDYSNLPKHHPELTRLKTELVAVQRKLMESEIAAKNALQNADYEIQALRMENQHHRKKIQQLLQQLTSERNTEGYKNLFHSLQLSEAKNRELEKQLGHYQQKVDHLHEQLRRPSSRERRDSEKKKQDSYRPFLAMAQQVPQTQHTIIPDPRPSINLDSTIVADPKHERGMQSEAKSTYSSASIYDQLVKDRQELRNARSDFEKRFGHMTALTYQPIPI